MAAVANCPQCEHELLIPEDATETAWAKCPSCRAFFQLRDAVRREIPSLVLLDHDPISRTEDRPRAPEAGDDFGIDEGDSALFGGETVVDTDIAEQETEIAPAVPSVEEILARYQSDLDRFAAGLAGASNIRDAFLPSLPEASHADAGSTDEKVEDASAVDDAARKFRSAETVADLPRLPEPLDRGSRPTEFIPRKTAAVTPPIEPDAYDSEAADSTEPEADVTAEFSETENRFPGWAFPGFQDESSESPHLEQDDGGGSLDLTDLSLRSEANGAEDLSSTESIDPPEDRVETELDDFERLEGRPTWDDPDHMERLLAEVEQPAPISEPPGQDSETDEYSLDIADEKAESYGGDYEDFESRAEEVDGDTADSEAHPMDPATAAEVLSIVPGLDRKRRRRSPAVLIGGTVLGGLLGIALGYYVLLWMGGPGNDFLNIAKFVPRPLLPASFTMPQKQVAASNANQETNHESSTGSLLDGMASSEGSASPAHAEVPASYNAPITADAEEPSDDRYLTGVPTSAGPSAEPLDFEVADAAPLESEPAAPVVLGAPSYSLAEIENSLAEARQAMSALATGHLSDESTQRAKGLSYTKYSQLAEAITFSDPTAPGSETDALKSSAAQLFLETLADPQIRRDVGYIASKWINYRKRITGGVLLAGQMNSKTTNGQFTEFQIDLGAGSPVKVVAPIAMADRIADSATDIAVAGAIIDQPAQRLSGYTGSDSRIIWAGEVIPLEE